MDNKIYEKDLPQAFRKRIKKQLGSDASLFFQSFAEPAHRAIRVNPLKGQKDTVLRLLGLSPEQQVPWEPCGYEYDEALQPGHHPLHAAGAFYIQEPSAMLPVAKLKPTSEDIVLDLCAAPGGKTTQIAAYMGNKGLLVSNEIHPGRAAILSENVERMGLRNCVVTNEPPEVLSRRFPGFFTKILVDAPCSGEGMFRKNPEAVTEWNEGSNEACRVRQLSILEEAAKMLRPGGILCYSTCTYAEEENEIVIRDFLVANPAYKIIEKSRIWPHKDPGEGHFCCLLCYGSIIKNDLVSNGYMPTLNEDRSTKKLKRDILSKNALVSDFLSDFLESSDKFDCKMLLFGNSVYLLPDQMPSLDGLKVLRPGLQLGTLSGIESHGSKRQHSSHGSADHFSYSASDDPTLVSKRAGASLSHYEASDSRIRASSRSGAPDGRMRFTPAHALALTLSPDEVKRSVSLSLEDAARYLHGEALPCDGESGWSLVACEGFSLGLGKVSNHQLKNHYPKGLRW